MYGGSSSGGGGGGGGGSGAALGDKPDLGLGTSAMGQPAEMARAPLCRCD